MKRKVITPSLHYPITLVEAKKQLGYYHSEDDDQVADFIADATREAEEYSGITAMFTTVEEAFDCFPCGTFELKGMPFVKIESIQYYDADNVLQTLSSSNYHVDDRSEFARLQPANSWPSTYSKLNAVIVQYVVGHAGVFTANADTDTLSMEGHPFSDGDRVFGYKAREATFPTGLTERKPYYIINSDADSFQLSTEADGDAIDITDAGSGQLYIGFKEIPNQMVRAMKMMVTHFDQFRGDFVTGTIVQKMPIGSRYLLDQIRPKRV